MMPRRLAIVAHFNPTHRVADHVLRQLDSLREAFTDVVLASTSPISGDDRTEVLRRARILDRPNVGQDFGSWHDALTSSDFGRDHDELLLTNDSYVGVFGDMNLFIDRMHSASHADVWGISKSKRHGEHIQSYFLYFRRNALHSNAFREFWDDFDPAPDRSTTIMRHELGISAQMLAAGFRLDSAFRPTDAERLLANRRAIRFLDKRREVFPDRFADERDAYDVSRVGDPTLADELNWSIDLADSILDSRRLPVAKIETLRFDPHWLGSGALLKACEHQFPVEFDGVRRYLRDSAFAYPARAFENHRPAKLSEQEQSEVGYRANAADHFAASANDVGPN